MRDFYDILGVPRGASAREIKQAYRKLAMENHPDRNPDDEQAELRLKEANQAYEVLRDEKKRETYDLFGVDGLRQQPFTDGAGFADVEDIFNQFSDIFGDVFGFNSPEPAHGPGEDLRHDLELEFEEAAFGVHRSIHIKREEICQDCDGAKVAPGGKIVACPHCQGRGQIKHKQGIFAIGQTCPKCQGSGKLIINACPSCQGQGKRLEDREILLKIPPGVDENTKLRIRQEGAMGSPGHPRGDLFVILHVKPSPIFSRDGLDLHTERAVPCLHAMLGCTLRVPTLSEPVSLQIPEGTPPDKVFCIKGLGIQHPAKKNRRGDLFVHIKLTMQQTSLSPQQRELLEQLARTVHPNEPGASPQAAIEHKQDRDLGMELRAQQDHAEPVSIKQS